MPHQIQKLFTELKMPIKCAEKIEKKSDQELFEEKECQTVLKIQQKQKNNRNKKKKKKNS